MSNYNLQLNVVDLLFKISIPFEDLLVLSNKQNSNISNNDDLPE